MTTRVPHHPATFSLLTLAVALGVLASVIYVPSIPAIALALGVGEGAVQHSMTLYLLAFAVSTLLIGPISDRLGRRPTLIGGLVLFSLSGVACALSDTILTLQLARMVQGVGACACMIVGRAVVRDIYDRERTARAMAILGIVVASGPALAPLLGGQPELYALYQLVFFRKGQRKHEVMSEVVAEMSDDDLRALAAWVGTLPPPPAMALQVERSPRAPEKFDRGAELARSHRCGVCHEPDLAGREHMPRLAGQQEAYLLKTLQDYKAGRRVGIQAAMAEVLSDMDAADLEALAHFMAHLPDRP